MALIFRPIEPERAGDGQQNPLLALVAAVTDPDKMSALHRNITGFGAHVGYQLKELRAEGTSVLTFKNRTSVERQSLIAFNLGDLYRQHGKDPDYFRAVNLGDPMYQQREVRVSVDG